MKKIFTTILLVAGICTFTQAQKTKGDTEFGIGGGYNQAYLTASGASNNTAITHGFNVAVALDHYFSDRWSLKAKAIYDQKGWSDGFITTPTLTLTGVEFRTAYITVPVMANWHFGKTRNWYLDFGPYVGFLTSATANAYNTDVKDALNSTDGGLALGIGVKIPISNTAKFYIEYDGQAGVANVIKSSATPTGATNESRNSRGSFNIGLNF